MLIKVLHPCDRPEPWGTPKFQGDLIPSLDSTGTTQCPVQTRCRKNIHTRKIKLRKSLRTITKEKTIDLAIKRQVLSKGVHSHSMDWNIPYKDRADRLCALISEHTKPSQDYTVNTRIAGVIVT